MIDSELTDRRPYIIRALYEWMLDNNLTPHIVINICIPNVFVPIEYAHDGQIILNIAPAAVDTVNFDNEKISFSTRFDGVLQQISLPPVSIIAIFASENSEGMLFEDDIEADHLNLLPELYNYQYAAKNKTILSLIKRSDLDQNKKEENLLQQEDKKIVVEPQQTDQKEATKNNNYIGLRIV
ncbi:ClpXP protease specificity-enhancing factor [Candidatus Erwinia haradaeae]|uniref:Stringent starvation protein B n=1 Tax=Candidatus Erwinia haradaeae TaxID=1922217 RepID=A0A451D1U8_9GAMM|nr:ClpXP protease specificity-enhancing factor [Candidatus Erwinia haradaeae]VFP79593.1 Stringent starvation protein B [Candidatus Erwinia haradaeae]